MGLTGDINNVRGRAEIGFDSNKTEDIPNRSGGYLYLRHLFAGYAIGPLNLVMGQTWTSYTYLSSKNVADDEGNHEDAGTYDGRLPKINLSFLKIFYVEVIKPHREHLTWYNLGTEADPVYIGRDNLHFKIPKLAAGISVSRGPLSGAFHIVYQKFSIDRGRGSTDPVLDGALIDLNGKTISGVMIPVTMRLNLASLTINFNGYWGENIGTMGVKSFSDVTPDVKEGSISDNRSMGGRFDFSFHAIIGYLNFGVSYETSRDDMRNAKKDVTLSHYVNFMFYLEKNLYIAPAWWHVDKKKNGSGIKEGTMDKIGLKFYANF